jgi:hypothetical protein
LDAFTKIVDVKFMNHLGWILVSIPLFTLNFKSVLNDKYRYYLTGALLLEIAYFMCKIALTMKSQIDSYPEWDFSWFWVYGQVAIQGLNFIDPSYVRELAQSFNYSSEFIDRLDFPYLPPAIFLFAWLGYFKFKVAYGLWYILHSLFLLFDTVLLKKIFFPKGIFLEWASIAVLILALPGTLSNFYFGQTHTLLLFLFLLFWQSYSHFQGGAYLALGILVKPLLAFFLLYMFLKHRWAALSGFLMTLNISFLLTILCFGATTVLGYFSGNPSARKIITYVEHINQSFLATTLHINQHELSEKSSLIYLLFIAIALGLLVLTFHRVFHLKRIDLALSIVLVLSLLMYPGTLAHHSMFLIVPILLVCRYSNTFFYGRLGATFFVFCQYIFLSYDNLAFVIFLCDWVVLMALSFVWLKKPVAIQEAAL